MSAQDESYSQEKDLFTNLYSRVQKTITVPAVLEATMEEVCKRCGFKSESDMLSGLYFYFLAFFTEPTLSVQVMNDDPELREKCFREAIERYHRLKNMTPEQRHAAEGVGSALKHHIDKIKNLTPPTNTQGSN